MLSINPNSLMGSRYLCGGSLLLLMSLLTSIGPVFAGEFSDPLKYLREASRDDREGLDALGESVRRQSLGVISDVVKLWLHGDANQSWKAAYLLGRLGDSAMEPLLEGGAPTDPLRQAWRMKRLTQLQLERREAIIELLRTRLADRTIVPFTEGAVSVEDPPDEERLCDLAYLHLRQLLNTGEAPDEQLDMAYLYRRLEPEERDRIIERYQRYGVWVNLYDWEPVEPSDTDGFRSPKE